MSKNPTFTDDESYWKYRKNKKNKKKKKGGKQNAI